MEQRIEVTHFGFKRMETPYVVRQVSTIDNKSSIAYSRLSDVMVETVISEEIEFFSSLGHEFEWKVFDHDRPGDLRARLIAHRFEPGESDALLVLDLASIPESRWECTGTEVRTLTSASQLSDVSYVEEAIWNEDFTWLREELSLALVQDPKNLSVHAVYVDGQPVSCAWIRFHPNSQFASLWGGSTLPDFRGQGFYRALVATRAREALARKVRFLTVDASPMSRPILERFGFRLMSFSHPCVWQNRRSSSNAGVASP